LFDKKLDRKVVIEVITTFKIEIDSSNPID
jgi:hypothetical protein